MTIPRTLIFVTSRNHDGERVVLLLKGAPTKRLWANRYNGLGGHIEAGEEVRAAALRELAEETGIVPHTLMLRGVVHIDTGYEEGVAAQRARPGIMVFVFHGEAAFASPIASAEGQAEWIPLQQLDALPMVDDLPDLLAHTLGEAPFFYGVYSPASGGELVRHFTI